MIHYSIEKYREAHDPAIPFLDVYPRELETYSNMFIAVLLTTAKKKWKQPKCSQGDRYMKCGILILWNIIWP